MPDDNPIDSANTVDPNKPYPYPAALDQARRQIALDPAKAMKMLPAASAVLDQYVQEFRAEEWPLVIRAGLYTVALQGSVARHHVEMDHGQQVAVAFHLNATSMALVMLHDHMVDLDPEARL